MKLYFILTMWNVNLGIVTRLAQTQKHFILTMWNVNTEVMTAFNGISQILY